MIFKGHAILFGLLAQPVLIWAATNYGQLESGITGAGRNAEGADEDVKAINAVSGLTQAQKIATDIQGLTSNLQNTQSAAQGDPPTGDNGVESDIIEAFDDATDDFSQFFEDLKDKAGELNELDQGSTILTALEDFKAVFVDFSNFLISIIESTDGQAQISESEGDVLTSIDEAEDEFQPETPPKVKRSRIARSKV